MQSTTKQDRQQQAWRAFQRDLPALLTERAGEWIAYQGERQVGFAPQKHLLYQRCFDQGLLRDEFVIFCVEPQDWEMALGPVVLD